MFVAEILKTKGNAVFSIAPDRTVADLYDMIHATWCGPWPATGRRRWLGR